MDEWVDYCLSVDVCVCVYVPVCMHACMYILYSIKACGLEASSLVNYLLPCSSAVHWVQLPGPNVPQ